MSHMTSMVTGAGNGARRQSACGRPCGSHRLLSGHAACYPQLAQATTKQGVCWSRAAGQHPPASLTLSIDHKGEIRPSPSSVIVHIDQSFIHEQKLSGSQLCGASRPSLHLLHPLVVYEHRDLQNMTIMICYLFSLQLIDIIN